MRVLFVTQYVDHILFFFLKELAARTSLTVVFEAENEWTRELAHVAERCERIVPRSRFDRQFQAAIERLWSAGPFDVIQSFHGNSQLANLILWNKRGVPIVGYRAYIGHLTFFENPSAYWSVRSPRLAAVVAVSTAARTYLQSFRFLKPRNVEVVCHGINRQWLAEQSQAPFGLREKLGLAHDAFIVMYVASLRPYKHFELFASAARQLSDPPIHFVHVGNAKGWEARAGNPPNLHFLGHQSRPFPIMAEADVLVSAAHNEAFGRGNLEAMALGKPLIGSNTGGLLDLIDDGVTGKLFKTQDADDFTRQVVAYVEDRSLVEAHGRNALARVDERFSSQTMMRQYLHIYERVAAR
ncbi:MAG: glycosyltransferase family 4 protein [Gammaproteobacteria bacterium]